MLKEALIASKLLGSGGGGGTKKMHFFLLDESDGTFQELIDGATVRLLNGTYGLVIIASESTECEMTDDGPTCDVQSITPSNYDESIIYPYDEGENILYVAPNAIGASSLTMSAGGESITISITVINGTSQE